MNKMIRLKFLRYHCLDRHHCAVQYQQLIDGIIERFHEAHPEIKIDSTILRNWYQYTYLINKTLPTDNAPDVIHTNGGKILEDMVASGLIHNLTDDLNNGWIDSFVPATLVPLQFNYRYFGIPLEQGCVFVWYNKTIFNRLNLPIPQTFDELLEICKELRKAGIIPFSMGNAENWPGDFHFSHLFHRIGGDDMFVSDFIQAPNYKDIRESFIEAGRKIIQMVDAGAFEEDCNKKNYYDQRSLFIHGKTAMQVNGNRLLNYLIAEGPGILDHVDYFHFPIINGGKGISTTILGGSLATYAVSSRSKNKEAAVLFLQHLTDELAARDIIFKMGDIPAVKYIPEKDYPSPIQSSMAQSLSRSKKVQLHYFKYLSPHSAGTYLNAISKLFTKDISPEGAFEAVEKAQSKKNAASI